MWSKSSGVYWIFILEYFEKKTEHKKCVKERSVCGTENFSLQDDSGFVIFLFK